MGDTIKEIEQGIETVETILEKAKPFLPFLANAWNVLQNKGMSPWQILSTLISHNTQGAPNSEHLS